jgi:short-subunit dehydrogenase
VHAYYGRVDGLVNNAGRSYAASVEEIDPAVFEEIFHLNVLGPIVAMQTVIPQMRKQGGGSIVNINSGTAFMTIPQYSVYTAEAAERYGISDLDGYEPKSLRGIYGGPHPAFDIQ